MLVIYLVGVLLTTVYSIVFGCRGGIFTAMRPKFLFLWTLITLAVILLWPVVYVARLAYALWIDLIKIELSRQQIEEEFGSK